MNSKHRETEQSDAHYTINELKQEKIFLKEINKYLSKKGVGAGLGLCLCKKIIESHDGKIWATNTIGRGMAVTSSML